MGRLAHLQDGIERIKSDLKRADVKRFVNENELGTLLDTRFNQSSDRLVGALNRLLSESDKTQDKSLKKAIDGVVTAVTGTHGIFKDGLAQISQEVALSHNILTEELGKIEIDGSLAERIEKVGKSVGNIKFPKQKDVDLEPIMFGLKMLSESKPPDFSAMEKKISDLQAKLDKRVHVFDVSYKNDRIKTVTVRVK